MTEHEADDRFDWAAEAHTGGGHCLYVLVRALERGSEVIPIDPVAWDNTMAAVAWALREHVLGHVRAGVTVTEANVEQARRLHALGAPALAGAARSPELLPLAERCLVLLYGPRWRAAFDDLPETALVYPPPSALIT